MFFQRLIILLLCTMASARLLPQTVFTEASATISDGQYAPLWLSSNRHGVISPYANSSYERVGAFDSFSLRKDSAKNSRFTYCADIMLSQNAVNKFFIHQLYAELKYRKFTFTLGQKERNIEHRNDTLTSGGLSNGINAQPMPGIAARCDYFTVPGLRKWLKVRGYFGVYKTTDGKWQKNWVADDSYYRYTSNVLLLEKSLFLKIAPEGSKLFFEPSLQMMTQFGGTSYNVYGRNHHDTSQPIHHPENLKAFWNAFCHFGSNDVTDGAHPNSSGNTLGSYNIALTWQDTDWMARAYFERFFEDQSMLTVQYGIFDHLLGIELALTKNRYLSGIVLEHLSTKDQSGPVYHDFTDNIPESYTGIDDYYNHNLYSGWQHWGMGVGNPLITSPVYNNNHQLRFRNNRVKAWHLGVQGNPSERLSWRALATITQNWGTYIEPLDDIVNTQHYLVEAAYVPAFLPKLKVTLAASLDHGKILGNSFGAQCTFRYSIRLPRK